jgi:hypothetical protein
LINLWPKLRTFNVLVALGDGPILPTIPSFTYWLATCISASECLAISEEVAKNIEQQGLMVPDE